MLQQAQSRMFRFRVNLWSRITGRGAFDWDAFMSRLSQAEFRQFASVGQAARSLGWAGPGARGGWRFGVAGRGVPLYGRSAMRHELFHAAQDLQTGLFSGRAGILRSVAAEYSAHLWGSPLIGVPVVYGGTAYGLYGIYQGGSLLFGGE